MIGVIYRNKGYLQQHLSIEKKLCYWRICENRLVRWEVVWIFLNLNSRTENDYRCLAMRFHIKVRVLCKLIDARPNFTVFD